MEGGSPKMIRKPLKVNQQTGIKQHFPYNANIGGYKGTDEPSIMTWPNPPRGTKGETINATNQASKQILRKNWRPIISH